jgi:uncharacterized membrane protein
MRKLSRLFKHWFTTSAAGRKAFPAATLKAIETAITEGEPLHRAEVRLIVEPALATHMVLQQMTSRQRAVELFSHYRIWDTEENCGVLVYINLADHKVEIVADRAVGRLVSRADWHAVCQTMTHGFAQGAYHDSVVDALAQLNAMLKAQMPADGARANQLSNKPVML